MKLYINLCLSCLAQFFDRSGGDRQRRQHRNTLCCIWSTFGDGIQVHKFIHFHPSYHCESHPSPCLDSTYAGHNKIVPPTPSRTHTHTHTQVKLLIQRDSVVKVRNRWQCTPFDLAFISCSSVICSLLTEAAQARKQKQKAKTNQESKAVAS